MRLADVFLRVSTLAVALLAVSCSNDAPVTGSAGTGQLTVQIHDQAAPTLTVAEVTFSSLEARTVDGVWVAAEGSFPVTLDLLQFIGPQNSTELVQDLVPAGAYDQLRITVTAIHLELSDGSTYDVPIPEGGMPVLVPVGFSVAEGGATEVVLDFRTDEAFQFNGTGVTFNPGGLVVTTVR